MNHKKWDLDTLEWMEGILTSKRTLKWKARILSNQILSMLMSGKGFLWVD